MFVNRDDVKKNLYIEKKRRRREEIWGVLQMLKNFSIMSQGIFTVVVALELNFICSPTNLGGEEEWKFFHAFFLSLVFFSFISFYYRRASCFEWKFFLVQISNLHFIFFDVFQTSSWCCELRHNLSPANVNGVTVSLNGLTKTFKSSSNIWLTSSAAFIVSENRFNLPFLFLLLLCVRWHAVHRVA